MLATPDKTKQKTHKPGGVIRWHSAVQSHVGTVRKINEDAVFSNTDAGLWAVADGMGGHEAGEVASQMIIHALRNMDSKPRLSSFVEYVDQEIQEVNRRIQQHSEMILENRILGSTIVLLIIRGKVGVCLWAGDSRLYRIHQGKLERLSKDHSKVEELIDSGLLLPEEASTHPESSVITRAVGASRELCLDHCVFPIADGDSFLLCSDGLYNCLSDLEIVNHFQTLDIDLCAQGLIDNALMNNASDNISVVVVRGRRAVTS